MASFVHFPLEFVEIHGVAREVFWALISELGKHQRQNRWLYGRIERELGWVNLDQYIVPSEYQSPEEQWLCNFTGSLTSFMKVNGFPWHTFVIPFNAGIPGDVFFVQMHCAGPYCMDFLHAEHQRAQSFYSLQHAKIPAVRREENKLILLHHIVSTCDPHWIIVYNFLYPGPSRTLPNHSYGSSRIPARHFLLLCFALLFKKEAIQAEENGSLPL